MKEKIDKRKKLFKNKPPENKDHPRNHTTALTNRRMRKIINFDFLDIVERKDTGYFLIGKNKLLVSPSMLNYQLSRKALASIPTNILEQRRTIGANLMENIRMVYEQKLYDTSSLEMHEIDRKYLNNFLDWLVENKIKVLAVEKFITNGEICGIVDLIVRWNECTCILEVKTRNNKEMRFTDYTQAATYFKLCRCPTYVVMIDDYGKVDYYRLSCVRKFEYYSEYCNFMKFWKSIGVLENEKISPIEID